MYARTADPLAKSNTVCPVTASDAPQRLEIAIFVHTELQKE